MATRRPPRKRPHRWSALALWALATFFLLGTVDASVGWFWIGWAILGLISVYLLFAKLD